jgi:PAS domain S-box-containing protein
MRYPRTSSNAEHPDALARAHARQITRRLPFFAALWLGFAGVWEVLQVVLGRASLLGASAYLAAITALLAVAFVVCRRDPPAARVPWIALATCLLLEVASAISYANRPESYAEVLAFSYFIIGLASALLFAWGWRVASILALCTLAIWDTARPWLDRFVASGELGIGFIVGVIVVVAIAEGSARSLRRVWQQGQARRRTMRELALSRDAYRDLAENASDLIYTHDLDGRFTYVNEAFARYAGAARETLIGTSALDVIDTSRPNPDIPSVIRRVIDEEAVPPVLLAVTTDQGERWVECVISGIRDADGRVTGVRGIARDVTARVRAEEALRVSYEEIRRREEDLRRLAGRQSAIREQERKRLGVDLHDGVCQEVVAIGFHLEQLRTELGPLPPERTARFDRLARYVSTVVEHLRVLAHDLRPMVLLDLGLEESLRALARGMESSTTKVETRFAPDIPALEENAALGIYRIAQEALGNAVRHASARTIVLALGIEGDRLRLEIRDDGRGFAVGTGRAANTVGLVSMEERARAIGGRLELHSAPGEGTTVRLDCPLQPRPAATAA